MFLALVSLNTFAEDWCPDGSSHTDHFYMSFEICVFLSEESERVKYIKFRNRFSKVDKDLMTEIFRTYTFDDIDGMSMDKKSITVNFTGYTNNPFKRLDISVKIKDSGSYELIATEPKAI
jgi:hypothetical protein